MLEEFLRILSASNRDQVDACVGAARLWALHRVATELVLQAYPETRDPLRLVVNGNELVQPLPDYMPKHATPGTYSDPVFDERGFLSDFSFKGAPVSQRVAAFRGNEDTAPVHVATVYSRLGTDCGIRVFPSGMRWGDPWRLTRDRHRWKRVVVTTDPSPDVVIGSFFGRAWSGPGGVIAAQLEFSGRSHEAVFGAERLSISLGKLHIEFARVWDLDSIPASDLLATEESSVSRLDPTRQRERTMTVGQHNHGDVTLDTLIAAAEALIVENGRASFTADQLASHAGTTTNLDGWSANPSAIVDALMERIETDTCDGCGIGEAMNAHPALAVLAVDESTGLQDRALDVVTRAAGLPQGDHRALALAALHLPWLDPASSYARRLLVEQVLDSESPTGPTSA